jgi:hypothetical protein
MEWLFDPDIWVGLLTLRISTVLVTRMAVVAVPEDADAAGGR